MKSSFRQDENKTFALRYEDGHQAINKLHDSHLSWKLYGVRVMEDVGMARAGGTWRLHPQGPRRVCSIPQVCNLNWWSRTSLLDCPLCLCKLVSLQPCQTFRTRPDCLEISHCILHTSVWKNYGTLSFSTTGTVELRFTSHINNFGFI